MTKHVRDDPCAKENEKMQKAEDEYIKNHLEIEATQQNANKYRNIIYALTHVNNALNDRIRFLADIIYDEAMLGRRPEWAVTELTNKTNNIPTLHGPASSLISIAWAHIIALRERLPLYWEYINAVWDLLNCISSLPEEEPPPDFLKDLRARLSRQVRTRRKGRRSNKKPNKRVKVGKTKAPGISPRA